MKALIREISHSKILAVGIILLIAAFLLALLSVYPQYYTYSNNRTEVVDKDLWGPISIEPPNFQDRNLRITASQLSLMSNVNLTANVYSNETLLTTLDLFSLQVRNIDLNRKTSVLFLNGTSSSSGVITLFYTVVGYILPFNLLGVAAAVVAIFGAVFAIRGYLSLLRELKREKSQRANSCFCHNTKLSIACILENCCY